MGQLVELSNGKSVFILQNKTSTGAGSTYDVIGGGRCTFSAYGKTSAGAGSVSVDIEVSNTGNSWALARNITLTLGTSQVEDGFPMDASWNHVRTNVLSISGTGATVSVLMKA